MQSNNVVLTRENFASNMLKNCKSVNKIIIVGHHKSGIELVESALCRSGMKTALPSRKEGFYPEDLTTLLCDAHRVRPTSTGPDDLRQIKPAAMWSSLLFDLALGNSEHAVWGWSDSRAIILTDYWLKSDPLASVVFVYSDPASFIDQGLEEVGVEAVHHQLDSWAAYNTEMLRVFSNHKDRCILASVRRLRAIPGACQGKLNMPFDLSKAAASLPKRNLPVEWLGRNHEEFDRIACAAKQYVAACYLKENPGYARLYDELQSAADLPDEGESSSQGDYTAIWESLATTPQLLALSYCRMRASLLDHQARQHQESGQQENLLVQLQQSLEEVEEYRQKITQIAGEVASEERSAAKRRIKEELRYRLGDALISHSRSLGGWLRMPFALMREIRRPVHRSGRAAKHPSKATTSSKRDKHKQELAVKQQLSYRLGRKLVKHARSPVGWVTMPFALVRETVAFKRKRRRLKSGSKTS